MKTTKITKERLNLDFRPEVKARILSMQERWEADSMTEVIRRSVKVAETLQDALDMDSVIIIRDRDGNEQKLLIT